MDFAHDGKVGSCIPIQEKKVWIFLQMVNHRLICRQILYTLIRDACISLKLVMLGCNDVYWLIVLVSFVMNIFHLRSGRRALFNNLLSWGQCCETQTNQLVQPVELGLRYLIGPISSMDWICCDSDMTQLNWLSLLEINKFGQLVDSYLTRSHSIVSWKMTLVEIVSHLWPCFIVYCKGRRKNQGRRIRKVATHPFN